MTTNYTRPSEADLPAALAEDVEKAAQELALGLGVSVSAGPYAYRTQPRITTLISAVRAEAISQCSEEFLVNELNMRGVTSKFIEKQRAIGRAEAIASTEARFRELADSYRKQDCQLAAASDIEALLTAPADRPAQAEKEKE